VRLDDQTREAAILLLAVVLLTAVHFHGHLASLGPREELFGWFAINAALLLAVPCLTIRLVFREPLGAYGLGLGEPRVWGRDLAVLALVFVPMVVAASRLPAMRAAYPAYRFVLTERWLWIPSTLGWGLYGFAWEFFFRGFLLFGLGRRLGRSAIFVQLVPFVMAHYPKSEIEALASIGGGLVFGVLAWRGRSFLGAWLLHWGAATAINVLAARGP
jgi:hypothetical protein